MYSLKKLNTIILKNPWKYNFLDNKRLLYSPSTLGLDVFIKKRERVQRENHIEWSIYKERIKEACSKENNFMIFSNDISKMVCLAKDEEDLDTLHKLLQKLKVQELVRVQNYNFNLDVMRLHYLMNRPLKAMLLIKDSLLCSEFQSPTLFVILLDLLFENNLFKEVIKMYNYRLSRSKFSFNIHLHIIFFAACYKLNTENSFKEALKVWQNFSKYGFKPALTIRLLFAALSVNQNQFFCAMEVLPSYMFDALSENIKCIIFAKSQRFDDAFENLKSILDKRNSFILKETIDAIEKEICKNKNQNTERFKGIKEDLLTMNKVKHESLDTYLFANLESMSKKPMKLHNNHNILQQESTGAL